MRTVIVLICAFILLSSQTLYYHKCYYTPKYTKKDTTTIDSTRIKLKKELNNTNNKLDSLIKILQK